MKLGVAGVRLCDTSGCYDRWPCARHGTLSVGPREGHAAIFFDVSHYPCCGYSTCVCDPVPHGVIPLYGWRHLSGLDWYIKESLPAGFCTVASDEYGWACKASENYWQHPVEAMLEAEGLARAAAEIKPAEPKPEKPLPAYLAPLKAALDRIEEPDTEPLMPRPGWAYDYSLEHYVYGNYKVFRPDDPLDKNMRWRVLGVESFATLREAMLFVEKIVADPTQLPW